MDPASERLAGIAFGRFQVSPDRREVLADGRPVKLGGRAFDVLMALIEAHGAVVSKEALMTRVWPGRITEENSLAAQIAALRAAFGAERELIRTVSGRGYQFTGEIRILSASPNKAGAGVVTAEQASILPPTNIPGPVSELIDRDHDLGEILSLTAAQQRELIRTIPGHGYQFTGETRILPASPDERAGAELAAEQPRSVPPPTNLPEPVSELIGRDDDLGEILSLTAAHRLVTLTGPGGIGKTRLALAAARQILPHFADGVWLAEFSPLADPGLVPATVAAAVRLELGAGEISAQRVAQALTNRRLLLVLDTCEHVIEAAVAMAEAVLRAGSAVRILATSREPLQAEAEQIYPVPPLAVPVSEAEDPRRHGAVMLFVVRSRLTGAHVSEDQHVAAIAAICRRLDGIPLAIELAAARASALGIEALAARLDDRFHLLTGRRRTALPRHQTLRATLDWSYELLTEPERMILRRLAIFAGAFGLRGASAVVASSEVTAAEVVDGLANLVAKSLVVAEVDGTVSRYRLLDTTRAYAFEKLGESGERERLARRHAEYYRDLFERAEAEWETRPTAEWLAEYGPRIDNLRAALDWVFSPDGEASIAVALTAAAVPLWMHLSLLDECRTRVERALTALGAAGGREERREMKLHAALGGSLVYTRGATGPEISAAWTRALELAESLDDAEYQFRSLSGLWVFHTAAGRYRVALALAERFCTLAANRSDPDDRLVGERLIGVSQHYLGDQPGARHHIERFLAHYATRESIASRIIRFQHDQRVIARAFLARVLWLQGFPEQAMRAAESSIEDGRTANHVTSLCYALALAACPTALSVGDLAAAEYYVSMLLDHSTRYGLARWRASGHCLRGVLIIKLGDVMTGVQLLRAGLDELGEAGLGTGYITLRGILAEALGRAGQTGEGLATIEEGFAWTERTEER
jgi:predicted ATPase/DNA-binding winged helix-turn-helix (wHTH) protein